ncbi:AAA family ATPase [Nocardia salmonicida]|uniref:AAA family ATPase n=1 Tax=Nocardia salmonicida TaxID=53431 RepID=UPI0007A3C451|nr:AAA family ATPase [Nocardia salmonicida]MBC7299483.1 AAA family ATPase [Nocardia sp.]
MTSLRQLATVATSGVTIICGFPASGKSTATRFLADLVDPVVLDKDTFAPRLEESVMSELNGSPFDRDSDLYRRVVAPHVYSALLSHAVRVGARCPVLVDAPFLGHVRAAADSGVLLSDYIRSVTETTDVEIRTAWVNTDTARIRERMVERGADRDQPKLTAWDDYRTAVLDSGLAQQGPAVVDHVVAN